jgi:hypothetical protein
MMDRYRYRRLTSSRDAEAVAYTLRSILREAPRRDAAVRAEVEAPLAVEAREGEGEFAEVSRMLQAGELVKSDLVFSHGQWTTFADSVEFGELCQRLWDPRSFWRGHSALLANIGLGAAFAALLVAFFWMLWLMR